MEKTEDENNNSDKVLVLPLNEDSKKVTQALSNEKALKMLEMLADKPMSATTLSEKMGLPLTTIKYNLDSLVEADLIKVKETKWSQKGREIKIYEPVQKLIVVVPGTKNVDRSSIMGMLKKYLGLFMGAVFAATGIEYLTRRMGFYSSSNYSPAVLEEAAMKSSEYTGYVNESFEYGANAFDQANASGGASPMLASTLSNDTARTVVSDQIVNATSSISPAEGLTTPYVDMGGMNATDMNATIAPVQYPTSGDVTSLTGNTAGLIPPDFLAHVSVWFFFGCMFVILFMLIREIYYRKKSL